MGAYKILVVDDSETIRAAVQHIINKHKLDYELTFAADGRSACKLAAQIIPDLILMDLIMPEMGGIKALELLKKNSTTQDIPIVIMTAVESLNEAINYGANDFIYKPFDEFELLFRLRFALTLSENMKKIKLQNELLTKQSTEMKRQYKALEEQRKDIIDDITYSRRIQNATMPSKDYLSSLFNQYFLYFKPKRIVSGDFYWVAHKGNKTILAVADCTGHGISGAFLTIAGTAFLNEIINYVEPNASEILNQLRIRIMRLLQQKGLEGEASDGMDISLCIFDFEEMTLQYAGANNPVYIVRNDGNLQICSADRMPIGIHEHSTKPFTNNDLLISKGDMVYMFSDGYADQFGGPHDQKFRYKRLQALCVEMFHKSMPEQYDGFERNMDEWIGYRDQIDDIIVIGVKI
jgi:sigma-B regulation protein RsbU (phosphoserine phosphatase)